MILCPLLPAFFSKFPMIYETSFLLCLFVTYLFFSLVLSFFFSFFFGARVVFILFFPHPAIFIPPPPPGGGGIFQYIDPCPLLRHWGWVTATCLACWCWCSILFYSIL